ncbi:MAG: RNA polymerase sigma factor (sigma-70 family) [Saprospiraceae bacterium]
MNKRNKDYELIKNALEGNQGAYQSLYELYKNSLFVVCLRYAKDRSVAQDYLQESFINIFKNLGQFDELKGAFEAWAKRITINVCLADIRKNSLYAVNISSATEIESDDVSPLSNLSLQEMLSHIQMLPVGYKTVFNMYVIDGFSHKEIAEELGITTSTSKSQLMKARNVLKNKILDHQKIYSQEHG